MAGPLTDIIQMLLTTIFNVQDEEAAENKNSQAGEFKTCSKSVLNVHINKIRVKNNFNTFSIYLTSNNNFNNFFSDLNSEDMTETMSLSDATHLATLASSWSVNFQGMSLSRLPLYPLTATEILRLHLLSSGARLNEAATKWRYQQRGGYMSEDDPGLQLRIKYPHILKALAIHNVNQLSIGDKLKILSCLIDQLLTYADVRDMVEEKLDKLRQVRLLLSILFDVY